jgi:hypothetical protein
MSDRDDERQSSARGEAAWKEAREQIASRNDATRKAGKESRSAYERKREDTRRAAEGRRQAKLVSRRRTP